jgi:hypothetical protein
MVLFMEDTLVVGEWVYTLYQSKNSTIKEKLKHDWTVC